MRLVEQREREGLHHQRRHEILEHAPAPREQRPGSSGGSEGSAEPEPVIDRHVVLGNRYERGESGLRSEQVVVRVVHRVAADVISDGEQLSLAVVQKAEIHLDRVGMGALGDCPESLGIRFGAGLILQHLVARLLQSDQMSGEISAVDRRDVRRLQHSQLVQVVPVEEVSVEPSHPLQRPEHFFYAIDHVRSRDEAEIGRADCGQKLKTDIRGGCAKSQHWLRVFLEVVGSKPLRFLGHEFLEVHPVQLRVTQRCLALGFSEMNFAENRGTAERGCNARAREPCEHQRKRSHDEQEAIAGARGPSHRNVKADRDSQHETERSYRPHLAPYLEL